MDRGSLNASIHSVSTGTSLCDHDDSNKMLKTKRNYEIPSNQEFYEESHSALRTNFVCRNYPCRWLE